MRADQEWKTLPCIILVSNMDWDLAVLDYLAKDNEEWFDTQINLNFFMNLESKRNGLIIMSRIFTILMQILIKKMRLMVLFRIVQIAHM